VCCAAPLGYGPATKLAVLAAAVREHGIRPVFLGSGSALEAARRTAVFAELVAAEPGEPRARATCEASDGLLSLMERDHLRTAQDLGRPTFVADSLLWMRDAVPPTFRAATRYWAQDFPGVVERAAGVATVVGPIVAPPPPRARRPNGLVVALGGAPCAGDDDVRFLDLVVDALVGSGLVGRFSAAVCLASESARAVLESRHGGRGLGFVSVAPDEALALLASAALVVAMPGLTTTLECFQLGVPVLFLPPRTYSQWCILDTLRDEGLAPQALHWSDRLGGAAIVPGMPEAGRTERVLATIRPLLDDDATRAALCASLNVTARLDAGALAAAQAAFFARLGENAVASIAGEIAAALPTTRTTMTPDVDRIAAALGGALHVPYAPPHIYPMAAPRFRPADGLERPRPHADPLALYAHVPFCNYACTFCFYAKRVGDDAATKARYVDAVLRELAWLRPGTRLRHLYLGGGTPTALPAPLLDRLLGAILARTERVPGARFTVEGSPESLSAEHVAVLATYGIGRVSVGIQSLDTGELGRIHRRHDGEAALAVLRTLVARGFVVNADLIYGLPGQTEASFGEAFGAVVAAGVDAVTTYGLRVNERTPVARILAPEERLDLERRLRWRLAVKRMADDLGLVQTRWHTFVRPGGGQAPHAGRPPVDDTGSTGDQLGVGPSARSRLGTVVYRNHPDLDAWQVRVERDVSPVAELFELAAEDRRIRFLGTTLGDGQPLRRAAWLEAFGTPIEAEHGPVLERLRAADLVGDDDGALVLTETGKLVHDLVTLAFYPPGTQRWLAERQEAALARRGRTAETPLVREGA
jgi:oxygen-independent coproporphyrinogen-3 oxidase